MNGVGTSGSAKIAALTACPARSGMAFTARLPRWPTGALASIVLVKTPKRARPPMTSSNSSGTGIHTAIAMNEAPITPRSSSGPSQA